MQKLLHIIPKDYALKALLIVSLCAGGMYNTNASIAPVVQETEEPDTTETIAPTIAYEIIDRIEEPKDMPEVSTSRTGGSSNKPSKGSTSSSSTEQPSNKKVYNLLWDLERDYMGTCPSQSPTDLWRGKLQPSVAVGVSSFNDGSLKSDVTAVWNMSRGGEWVDGNRYPVALADKSLSRGINGVGSFVTDTDTLTVYYYMYPGYEDLANANLDRLASEMTSYLRWLDSSYNAKCPNG